MGWTGPRTWGAGETHLATVFNTHVRDNFVHLKANISLGAAIELTIETGAVTKTQSHHTFDTEGDAATDDLDTINGGSEGEEIVGRAAHTDRTVVAKHGTGNLELAGGADFSMDTTEKALKLFYNGSKWLELGRTG